MNWLFTSLGKHFLSTLSWWQWLVLAAVPPLIIMLYFLKLRRQPLEVPSTYLWRRTIEDLHVNSIWQRLRQSLLLLLQILLILLVIFACLRPGWLGTELVGKRFIFLIDTSASMNATDEKPSRLEAAKERAGKLIDQMKSGDEAMIISFSDVARVEQSYSDNKSLLRRKLGQIKPTNRPTDLTEALRAASGLANPGMANYESAKDVPVGEAQPATLYIYSDGGVAAVPNFSLGNLTPDYRPVGMEKPKNLGIVSFTAERNPEKEGQVQAFGRIENSGDEDVDVEVDLFLNGKLQDAQEVSVPKHDGAGVKFSLEEADFDEDGQASLRMELKHNDDLALDNVAHAAFNAPRKARVLVVTPHNDALKLAMETDEAIKLAEVKLAEPALLESKAHLEEAAASLYDLIVYDQCAPKTMPQANTLFVGRVPPLGTWSAKEKQGPPLVVDTDRVHPLMQLIELGNVRIIEATPLTGPQGSTVLIDADIGPIFVIGPREGFEDAVLGFEIFGKNEKGEIEVNTDWHIRRSFPTFVMNVVKYLGGTRGSGSSPSVQPGKPIVLQTVLPVKAINVESPSGLKTQVAREGQNSFQFSDTDEVGPYSVREGSAKQVGQRFAVNLFDTRESNLVPRDKLEIGHEEVKGTKTKEQSRQEIWKWILIVGLLVLIFEWYIYNKRVYL
jgi:hypothetical protein